MLERGDVVFFKRAKASTDAQSKEYTYAGWGYGILLGNTLVFGKDPSPFELIRTLGTTGFFSLNDIEDFLGKAARDALLEKFIEKYDGKKPAPLEAAQQELPLDIPPPDAL